MSAWSLRILLTASLLVALLPSRVMGRGCCLGQHASSNGSEDALSDCAACCQDCQEDASLPARPHPTPNGEPCKSGCVHWCCGAGFVPLSVVTAAPLLERAADSPTLAVLDAPLDGFHPRIEHPPRLS